MDATQTLLDLVRYDMDETISMEDQCEAGHYAHLIAQVVAGEIVKVAKRGVDGHSYIVITRADGSKEAVCPTVGTFYHNGKAWESESWQGAEYHASAAEAIRENMGRAEGRPVPSKADAREHLVTALSNAYEVSHAITIDALHFGLIDGTTEGLQSIITRLEDLEGCARSEHTGCLHLGPR